MTAQLTDEFHRAMLTIYERAKRECRYNANFLLSMVSQQGGVQAAHALLGTNTVSDGFVRLWELGRLDLSVEALVLQPQWRSLFTEDELNRAKTRLQQLGYQPKAKVSEQGTCTTS